MRTQAEEKEGHFCSEICTQCLCFHGCYLPPLPTTQPHPPPEIDNHILEQFVK